MKTTPTPKPSPLNPTPNEDRTSFESVMQTALDLNPKPLNPKPIPKKGAIMKTVDRSPLDEP